MATAVTIGGAIDTIAVDRLLASLGKQVTNLRPFFTAIDADLTRLFREQFETRGARLNGAPWAALSPATIELRIARRILSARARRRARNNAGRDVPLYDTGGLYSSFTKPDAPWSVRQIGPLEMIRGSRYAPDGVPVAALHQEGWASPYVPVFTRYGDAIFVRRRGGPKRVPARPVVPREMPAPVLRAWEAQLEAYVEEGAV